MRAACRACPYSSEEGSWGSEKEGRGGRRGWIKVARCHFGCLKIINTNTTAD